MIGGNFLHSLNIGTQLRVYAIELATKVPRKFRFPHFVKLLWHCAQYYAERLAAALNGTWPQDMPPRVLDGLEQLATFLLEQTTRFPTDVAPERRRIARENVPWQFVKDPVLLVQNLQALLQTAKGTGSLPPSIPPSEPPAKIKPATTRPPAARPSPGAAPAQRKLAPGSTVKEDLKVVSTESTPLVVQEETQTRVDPLRPELGSRPCVVKMASQNTRVVRRSEVDGVVTIETRTVVTEIERVTWSMS